jgi:hypothetical protein
MDRINKKFALFAPAILVLTLLMASLFGPVTKANAPYPLPTQEQVGSQEQPAPVSPIKG